MKLARIVGHVVSTIKDERHEGWRLLLAQPVDEHGRPYAKPVVAIGAAQAGVGDYVLLIEEGKSARAIMDSEDAPCEAIVAGVVDHLMTGGEQRRLAPPIDDGEEA